MAKILITNGGPHPPEKWATVTAERIFDIGSSVVGDRLIEARKFQAAIVQVLLPHCDQIQLAERDKLDTSPQHLLKAFDVHPYLYSIMQDILSVTKNTPWQTHFADPVVQAAAREVIASHIATAQHVERLWHADHHPEQPEAQTYREICKI